MNKDLCILASGLTGITGLILAYKYTKPMVVLGQLGNLGLKSIKNYELLL